MSLVDTALSALLQVTLLSGMPFLAFFVYHRWRHGRSFGAVARRAGLQVGARRYLAYSVGFALLGVGLLVLWPPPLDPLTRQGSAQRQFVGLGLGARAIALAILNGVVQTAFAEELLFRGLIGGSLSRRLPVLWANVLQALLFLFPHLLVLLVMPEAWPILPLVFAGALLFGWVRIKSGSILGPWLMHASGNVTMALMVAARTST